MIKKIFIFGVILYFLNLLEKSYFIHFFPYLPSLILVIVFLVNLLEEREKHFGIFLALIGGFILDLFSFFFFGFFIISSLALAFFIKIVIKRIFTF